MNTQLIQFTSSWTVARAYIFPTALWSSFSPMSNSGGSFGPDGWLYITGHDASEIYALKLPDAGDGGDDPDAGHCGSGHCLGSFEGEGGEFVWD